MIAASGVIAWEHADGADRTRLIALFAVNGVLNVLWSPLFFKLRRPDWALYELLPFWLSVLALVIELSRMSSVAGWLIAPYLAWVTFAGWLNWRVVQLNRPFGSGAPRRRRESWRQSPCFLMGARSTAIVALIAIEGLVLVTWRARTGVGPPIVTVIANLLAGASLLIAMRAALTGASIQAICGYLALAGAAHVADLAGRWRAAVAVSPGRPAGP